MTVAELIAEVLGAIQRQLYADRPKDFFRDRTALTKAIGRYGYACNERDWQFDVAFILSQIMEIIQVCKRQGEIAYLPVYLTSAIDRHIGEHAEELNAKAKAIRTITTKAMAKVHVAPDTVREATAVETLSLLYRAIRRHTKAQRPPKAKTKQGELL